MNGAAANNSSAQQSSGSSAPSITAAAGSIITGTGFLPSHKVTIRVSYTTEAVSDYLNYTTDTNGRLYAELPVSPGTGALHVTATDQRADPDGACGLLWSNTETLRTRNA
jgi:hypothetical protein